MEFRKPAEDHRSTPHATSANNAAATYIEITTTTHDDGSNDALSLSTRPTCRPHVPLPLHPTR
jgi:hypothetical protein